MQTCLACRTENPDGAQYCRSCGFTLRWREDDAPSEMPATQLMTAEIALQPATLRVAAGSDAQGHIAYEGPEAQWSVLGDAASFTSVAPAAGGAVVNVRPGPSEPPRSLPIVIHGLVRGQSALIVRGTVEVVPAGPPRQRAPGRRPPVAIVAVLAVSLLVAILAVALTRGGGDDGGGGGDDGGAEEVLHGGEEGGGGIEAVIGRASGANVREDATDQSGVVTSLPEGTEIVVDCAQNDDADGTRWARLVEPEGGRFVFAEFVLDRDSGEPVDLPDC